MTLAQARKAAVAIAVAALAGAAFIVDFDPSLNEAIIVLIGALFGAIGIFSAANTGPEDWTKAAQALQGAALSVAGYFVVVDPAIAGKIEALVAAAIGVYAVWRIPNAPTVPVERTALHRE